MVLLLGACIAINGITSRFEFQWPYGRMQKQVLIRGKYANFMREMSDVTDKGSWAFNSAVLLTNKKLSIHRQNGRHPLMHLASAANEAVVAWVFANFLCTMVGRWCIIWARFFLWDVSARVSYLIIYETIWSILWQEHLSIAVYCFWATLPFENSILTRRNRNFDEAIM